MPLYVKAFPGEVKGAEARPSHRIAKTFQQQPKYEEVQEKSIAYPQARHLLDEWGYPFLLLLPFSPLPVEPGVFCLQSGLKTRESPGVL